MATAALLIEKGALHPSDMPRMGRVIETVTDVRFSTSLELLVQGHHQLDEVHKEVRLRADSSLLAKTITGIASDSAEKAVVSEATTVAAADPAAAQ